MDALVITVAGISSRFDKSVGRDVLKCIYTEGDPQSTLFYRLVKLGAQFDAIVIVGGYKFEELERYIACTVPESILQKITLVENDHYEDRGSGWSLYLGLGALEGSGVESIVFAEGDLFFDEGSFVQICASDKDVISFNSHIIDASKAVAFYCDVNMHPRYIYDITHGSIEISEPFTRIYNSGQVWRFSDVERLFDISSQMPEVCHSKTNLELINRYFSSKSIDELDLIGFKTWINCNTVEDYITAFNR